MMAEDPADGFSARYVRFGPLGVTRLIYAPKRATGLSPGFQPGFQPWEPPLRRFALKGRQIERTKNANVGPVVPRLNCALYFLAQQ